MIKTFEEWKQVVGLEGKYSVSNHGRVMSLRTGKILVPKVLPNGYQRVKVTSKDHKRDRYVHRLVAEAFCNRPEGYDIVNHIDNDPTNNNSNNLEWTTQRGNVIHAMSQGRVRRFPNARMVIGIKDGVELVFRSSHEAAERIGCDHKSILKCCKTGRKMRNGYYWKVVA